MKPLRILICAGSAIAWLCAAGSSLAASIDLDTQIIGEISLAEISKPDATPPVSAGPPPVGGPAAAPSVPARRFLWRFRIAEISDAWLLKILGVPGLSNQGVEKLHWNSAENYVPEPGTAVLLAFGLFGLVALSGRKREDAGPKPTASPDRGDVPAH